MKYCASPRQPLMDDVIARPPRVTDNPIRPSVTVKEPALR
jgi:hypothetical protein